MSEGDKSGKKGDVTRRRILGAAAMVFGSKGYSGTRLADIAAAADLDAASLYYHFASREDLVETVLKVGQESTERLVRQRVESLPESTSNVDRLRELIRAHLASVLETTEYTSAIIRIFGQVPEDIQRRRIAAQQGYWQFWKLAMQEAQDSADIRTDVDLSVARLLIVGGLNASSEWYRPRHELPNDALSSQAASMFIDGLATRRGSVRRLPQPIASLSHYSLAGGSGGPRRLATRSWILDAAARTFRQRGYAGTRLTDIAAGADLQTGSLYYHFASREDLVSEFASMLFDGLAVRRTLKSWATNSRRLTPASS